MSVGYPWIFYVPTLLMVAFCLAAMIYVGTRSTAPSRPKRYAITALAIMFLSRIVFPLVINLVALRFIEAGNMTTISGIAGILSSGMMMLAIALLILAVFMDRAPAYDRDWDSGGTPLADQPSENPYAAPRQ